MLKYESPVRRGVLGVRFFKAYGSLFAALKSGQIREAASFCRNLFLRSEYGQTML